jgi:hypothetical protein
LNRDKYGRHLNPTLEKRAADEIDSATDDGGGGYRNGIGFLHRRKTRLIADGAM